jgi:hypothetical protein
MSYFYNIFCSSKILPETTLILDTVKEKTTSIKKEENLEFEYTSSPNILPLLKPTSYPNITSFICSYNYLRVYKIIYNLLLPYDPYFNHYENYWLIINKTYKRHRSIKISLYQNKENEILIDCFSMDKDDIFWKIYNLLKNHCSNVKKSKWIVDNSDNFEKKFYEI